MKPGTIDLSRGPLGVHHLFGLKDLGIMNPEPYVERTIELFLSIGEAVAARWIQMPNAILLLQMASDDPESGAIYLFDRRTEEFYLVYFDQDDCLTTAEFTELFQEYELLKYLQHPELLSALAQRGEAS